MPKEISTATKLRQQRGIIDCACPETYIPWINVRDCVSGAGRRHIIIDPYTNRAVHVMSDLEYCAYYMLRSNPAVQLLYEQVPLDISDTLKIAQQLAYRHPAHPRSKEPIVMTTDIVIYTTTGIQAIAVKPSSKLNNQRVLQKLHIEQAYWLSKHVPWYLMTEEEL